MQCTSIISISCFSFLLSQDPLITAPFNKSCPLFNMRLVYFLTHQSYSQRHRYGVIQYGINNLLVPTTPNESESPPPTFINSQQLLSCGWSLGTLPLSMLKILTCLILCGNYRLLQIQECNNYSTSRKQPLVVLLPILQALYSFHSYQCPYNL